MRACHVALASLVIIILWAGLRVMAIPLFQPPKSIEVVAEALLQAVNLGSEFMMGGSVSLWRPSLSSSEFDSLSHGHSPSNFSKHFLF